MTPARRRLLADLLRGAAAAQIVSPVPSPCRSICRMDRDSGYCEGCLRTIAEIAAWSAADDEERRRVWALLPARVPQLCEGSAA